MGFRWGAVGLLILSMHSFGQQTRLATTPPMGWNSWDAYGLTITESEFKANVDVLAAKLKPFGWNYAVIDEGWFLGNPEERPHPERLVYELDGFGRYIPVPARFPSAEGTGSFHALGAYVHGLGLRFGIHIVRGIPRESVERNLPVADSGYKASDAADTTDACPWDPTNWGVKDDAAGQAWYDSLLKQYAEWGIDYLKVDCIADHPYKAAEIRMIHRAIVKTGRPIVLSLSPGPTALDHAKEVGELAQMWRISDDIWDYWTSGRPFPQTVTSQFARLAAWQPYAKPGNWPDADMLPLGYLGPVPGEGKARETRLTHDEQRTQVTLWAIARSPLVLGANLTKLDEWTLGLLTNSQVLLVNQRGHGQRQVLADGNLVAWRSEGYERHHYLALFNLGDEPMVVKKAYTAFGFAAGKMIARDLWMDVATAEGEDLNMTLPPHGCVLLMVRAD